MSVVRCFVEFCFSVLHALEPTYAVADPQLSPCGGALYALSGTVDSSLRGYPATPGAQCRGVCVCPPSSPSPGVRATPAT